MNPSWLTAFIDLAPHEHALGTAFWLGVTGYTLSTPRGEDAEFATLVPPVGDDHLRIQRLRSSTSGTHLDLHVGSAEEIDAGVEEAVGLGATLLARHEPGLAIMRTPAGYPFCILQSSASEATPPVVWPDGHRSRVDQLCLDIPPGAYDAECDFWATLTGWEVTAGLRPEFRRLQVPTGLPLQILLQRLEDGPVHGHIDIATDDRAAEVARLAGLHAPKVAEYDDWTALRPPAGPAVCVTDRDPDTGRMA